MATVVANTGLLSDTNLHVQDTGGSGRPELHGDSDGTVPFAGSGARTHAAISHSELILLAGAPHGCNVSHADQFNAALLALLAK